MWLLDSKSVAGITIMAGNVLSYARRERWGLYNYYSASHVLVLMGGKTFYPVEGRCAFSRALS
jgi:hypothetical protein